MPPAILLAGQLANVAMGGSHFRPIFFWGCILLLVVPCTSGNRSIISATTTYSWQTFTVGWVAKATYCNWLQGFKVHFYTYINHSSISLRPNTPLNIGLWLWQTDRHFYFIGFRNGLDHRSGHLRWAPGDHPRGLTTFIDVTIHHMTLSLRIAPASSPGCRSRCWIEGFHSHQTIDIEAAIRHHACQENESCQILLHELPCHN